MTLTLGVATDCCLICDRFNYYRHQKSKQNAASINIYTLEVIEKYLTIILYNSTCTDIIIQKHFNESIKLKTGKIK